jgi:ElaB/YqjD/DUF883 family membrane-anchored ribosome-binding protein
MAKTESSYARLVQLRQEVEALTRDRVSPAVAGLAARAENVVGTTAVTVQHQSRAITGFVHDRPFVTVGAMAAAGWLLGRTAARRRRRRRALRLR